MDRKTLSIILGIILIACFFLPYLSLGGILQISGFDIISKGDLTGMGKGKGGFADLYLMLLWPLAGILLVVGALNDKYPLGRPVLGVLALLGTVYPLIRLMIEGGGNGMDAIFRFLGVGFWLSIVAAIVVIAYNPKKANQS